MTAAKLDDLTVRTALYHHERGRRYRPTRVELEANRFSCPRCGVEMLEVRISMGESALSCPSCRWSIHRKDLWSPEPEQEPTLREPGEATDDIPDEPIDSISVVDTLPVVPEIALS